MTKRTQQLECYENNFDGCLCRMMYAAINFKQEQIAHIKKTNLDCPGMAAEHLITFLEDYAKSEAAVLETSQVING